MNANELADYLDSNVGASVDSDNEYIDKAATMLRQQQAEIEALKAKCKWYDDIFRLPTETHLVKELTLTHEEYDNIFANGKRLGVIETENRLWKAMQLTNEEILEIWLNHVTVHSGGALQFARAILKRAFEK